MTARTSDVGPRRSSSNGANSSRRSAPTTHLGAARSCENELDEGRFSRRRRRLPVARMKRWYLAGDSNSTIGRRLGLHQSTVRRVLIEAGVTMRTRREQVALHDARAGVRVPSAEELAAGYVDEGLTSAELADRYGITEARVHSMLCRYGIERRPGGIRPERADAERAQRRPPQLIEDIVTLYRSGLSRTATAARVGVHRKLVDDVLRRAGVEFRDRRKLPPVE